MNDERITRLFLRRKEALAKRKAIVDAAESRGATHLSEAEDAEVRELTGAIKEYDERIADLSEEIERLDSSNLPSGAMGGARADSHPLAYTRQSLDALQGALDSRSPGRFLGGDTETRAALTTGTYGAPRAWGANVLNGPRLLHVLAGVPRQPADAVLAQHPVLTLPVAAASVGENVALAEYASSTAGSVTLARFGRFTDTSRESMVGTDAGALTAAHRVGIAKDLDLALINLVEANTGAAAAFTADVPAAIRKAMAQVIDNTAAADAAELVVLTHPDNAALLQDVAPTGGQTIAERFSSFSGAKVYASSAVDTGFMTIANLTSGARYFEARGVMTETEVATKTGTLTIATSVIAGYGLTLAGGAFLKVDVVTP